MYVCVCVCKHACVCVCMRDIISWFERKCREKHFYSCFLVLNGCEDQIPVIGVSSVALLLQLDLIRVGLYLFGTLLSIHLTKQCLFSSLKYEYVLKACVSLY